MAVGFDEGAEAPFAEIARALAAIGEHGREHGDLERIDAMG